MAQLEFSNSSQYVRLLNELLLVYIMVCRLFDA